MNRLDDDAAAINDIVNAPEVSGEGAIEPKKPLNLKITKGPVEPSDDPADERNARLFANSVNSVVRSYTGESMVTDQVEALSELATVTLSMLREAAIPRMAYLGVLGLILGIPGIPPIFKFINARKKEAQNA
jgi:hypothetical protein